MYETFFGLRERPFDLTTSPRFLFLTAKHREALSNLQYGIASQKGLTLITGEAGTGKTTLLRAAIELQRNQNVTTAYVNNPTLTRLEFYELLAHQFGLDANAAASKTRFLIQIEHALRDRHRAGGISSLLVDEAQSLPDELLEEIRLLSNLETATVKLLPTVLIGQPELADRLNQTSLRQLKQRVALRCTLAPLDLRETAAYIAKRIRVAGGDGASIFTREAVQAVYERSHGIPRTVNVICDNALVSAFALDRRIVGQDIVLEVCRDFDLAGPAAFEHAGPTLRLGTLAPAPAAGPVVPAPPTAPVPQIPQVAEPQAETPEASRADDDSRPPLFGAVTRRRRFSFF
jgi:type II secretory pathway predicted ATPase ExeA